MIVEVPCAPTRTGTGVTALADMLKSGLTCNWKVAVRVTGTAQLPQFPVTVTVYRAALFAVNKHDLVRPAAVGTAASAHGLPVVANATPVGEELTVRATGLFQLNNPVRVIGTATVEPACIV